MFIVASFFSQGDMDKGLGKEITCKAIGGRLVMRSFSWECSTKVRFGAGCVREYLADFVKEFAEPGRRIMIGYGGGSVKKNGAYDDVMAVLEGL